MKKKKNNKIRKSNNNQINKKEKDTINSINNFLRQEKIYHNQKLMK